MTDVRPTKESSLLQQLLTWSLGALAVVWLSFVVLAYRTGIEEADELTDGHLASVAVLLLGIHDLPAVGLSREALRMRLDGLKNHDYQQSLSVLVWDAKGVLRWHSGEAPAIAFDALAEGYATVQSDDHVAWRSFMQWNGEHNQKVAVLLRLDERDALTHDIAGQMIEPGLWLFPVVALALGLAIARGLRPLVELSKDVAAIDVQKAQHVAARHPVREVDAMVVSINTLLGRQQQALERERRLASEVAHELRTPLTAIALQAQALEPDLPTQAHRKALEHIRMDAMRAGHVLDQLLALARASRNDARAGWEQVDLAALARNVASRYAQAAWERGGSMEVHAETDPLVDGQPILLDIALRNLIENALRHTPEGTSIQVRCGASAAAVWLEVNDDGERDGVSNKGGLADSLHLGHAIVERVASVHGARFGRIVSSPPYTTCYRLEFGRVAEGGRS